MYRYVHRGKSWVSFHEWVCADAYAHSFNAVGKNRLSPLHVLVDDTAWSLYAGYRVHDKQTEFLWAEHVLLAVRTSFTLIPCCICHATAYQRNSPDNIVITLLIYVAFCYSFPKWGVMEAAHRRYDISDKVWELLKPYF